MSIHSMAKRRNDISHPAFIPSGGRNVPQFVWVVLDEDGRPLHVTSSRENAHWHIADAISEHDIVEAAHWVVREYRIATPTKESP